MRQTGMLIIFLHSLLFPEPAPWLPCAIPHQSKAIYRRQHMTYSPLTGFGNNIRNGMSNYTSRRDTKFSYAPRPGQLIKFEFLFFSFFLLTPFRTKMIEDKTVWYATVRIRILHQCHLLLVPEALIRSCFYILTVRVIYFFSFLFNPSSLDHLIPAWQAARHINLVVQGIITKWSRNSTQQQNKIQKRNKSDLSFFLTWL